NRTLVSGDRVTSHPGHRVRRIPNFLLPSYLASTGVDVRPPLASVRFQLRYRLASQHARPYVVDCRAVDQAGMSLQPVRRKTVSVIELSYVNSVGAVELLHPSGD